MKIGIVNDQRIAVEAIRRALIKLTWVEVLWIAGDGIEAVELAATNHPDVVLMDLVMPKLDGVEATRRIMAESPCAVLIVTSDVDENRAKVFEALGAGALDAVNTPIFQLKEADNALARKLEIVARLIGVSRGHITECKPSIIGKKVNKLLVIGASAGGPAAVSELLKELKSADNFSIALVQHVDVSFAASLAEWLNDQSPIRVELCQVETQLRANHAYVAGTEDHMIVSEAGSLSFTTKPWGGIYRPSIDVFLESAARNWSGTIAGALLTGMGKDGAAGLLELRRAGHYTVAQDKASCAVFGMPKAAISLGAAVDVLPIPAMAKALLGYIV